MLTLCTFISSILMSFTRGKKKKKRTVKQFVSKKKQTKTLHDMQVEIENFHGILEKKNVQD